jgi:hypothetical protein
MTMAIPITQLKKASDNPRFLLYVEFLTGFKSTKISTWISSHARNKSTAPIFHATLEKSNIQATINLHQFRSFPCICKGIQNTYPLGSFTSTCTKSGFKFYLIPHLHKFTQVLKLEE